MISRRWWWWLVVVALVVSACSRAGGYQRADVRTAQVAASHAFSTPDPGLSGPELARFRIGDRFFTEPWTPAVAGRDSERDGLGPTYVASACAGCHVRDGKANAPSAGGPIVYRLVDGPSPAYGVQIQDRAVDGVPAEGRFEVDVVDEPFRYPDGSIVVLRRPVVTVSSAAFGDEIEEASGSVRMAPALVGLGLLAAVPDAVIVDGADPDDRDGDGISGRPVRVGERVGRFGWKAEKATVLDQTAEAYLRDMGITSPLHRVENCPGPQEACRRAPGGGDPEISGDRLAAVAFYVSALAVPERRDPAAPEVIAGEALFDAIGCGACHRPALEVSSERDWIGDGRIAAYTDLLVHDMGPGLADGGTDGAEWRTAPLWGIGLVEAVNPYAGYLHDGRAATLEEAILWHGGEALGARDRFAALDAEDRARVIAFLRDL